MSEIKNSNGDTIKVYEGLGSQTTGNEYSTVGSLKSGNRMAGRLSDTMLKNHSHVEDKTLYDDLKEEEKKYWLPTTKTKDKKTNIITEGYGKRVKQIFLSNKQAKGVFALSYCITQPSDYESIKAYAELIEKKDKDGKSLAKNFWYQKTIYIRDFAFLLFGSDKERYVDLADKILKQLESIRQTQELYHRQRNGEVKVETIKEPLIRLSGEIWEEGSKELTAEEKEQGQATEKIQVTETRGRKRKKGTDEKGNIKGILLARKILFSPIFLQDIMTRFFYVPQKLLEVWGNRGNGTETELFPILLSELGSKFHGHYIAARKVSDEVWKDNSIPKKDKERIIAQRQKKALTYRIYTDTIKSKVATDYESKAILKSRFFKHLEQAIKVFIEVGILTSDTKIDRNHKTDKGYKVDFVFNYNYAKFNSADDIQEPEPIE